MVSSFARAYPGTAEQARDFFQRRLRTYLSVCIGMWLLLLALFTSILAVVDRPGFWNLVGSPAFKAELLCVAGLILTHGALRRWPMSERALLVIDFAATLAQIVVVAGLLSASEGRYRPEISVLLCVLAVLTVHAAVVPSTGRASAILAALGSIPILIGTYTLYSRDLPPGYPSVLGITVLAGMWCLLVVVVVYAISSIVHGLRQRVQEATELGQYRLLQKIGEGGMGVVYRAEHALLRRPTAVKLMLPEKGGDAKAHFEREVQLTAQLSHPNIVAVYDYGHTPEGVFYYAMEYLDGLDLETLVARHGPQPAGRVLRFLKQIASALAEAHHVRLIHRDVKPANVLLVERGLESDVIKVLDFGLVRDLNVGASRTLASSIVGTPLYMSPEQILGDGTLDGRADLYALGAVAYFLLTGAPPFVGDSVVAVCANHLHATPEVPSRRLGRPIPAELERLVLRLLAKAKEDRPESAVQLLSELETLIDVEPWTQSDAERWWREHHARETAPVAPAKSSAFGRSIAINLGERRQTRELSG